MPWVTCSYARVTQPGTHGWVAGIFVVRGQVEETTTIEVVQTTAREAKGVGVDRVAEIIEHEKLADDLQASADEHHWEAARLIAAELGDGKTQTRLAAEIGKGQGHVSKCAKIWRTYGDYSPENRPAWHDAYRSVSCKPKPSKVEEAERITHRVRLGMATMPPPLRQIVRRMLPSYDGKSDFVSDVMAEFQATATYEDYVAIGRFFASQVQMEAQDKINEAARLEAEAARLREEARELTGDE
jgi:hypothetical protein